MTAPIKAPKKPKNQPVTFQETIAAEPMYAPVADVSFHLSERQQRWGLIIVWILAMILVGVAVGWRIVSAQRAAAVPPGNPVAAADVSVTPLTFDPPVAQPLAVAEPPLAVTPAVSVYQAGAGSPLAVLSTGTFQPADAPDALVPGYQTELAAQGNPGTDPVR